MSKEKKYKYIKNGTIEGIEVVTMSMHEFVTQYPIYQTIPIDKGNGEYEPQRVYSRSGLLYRFKETDTITLKRPSNAEYQEIKLAAENGDSFNDVKLLSIKINGEDIEEDYFDRLLAPNERGELTLMLSNFILGLKAQKIV